MWPVSSYNLQIWIFWIFVEPLQEVIFSILDSLLSAPFENFQPIFGFIDIMWDVSVSKITYWKSRMEIEYLVWMFIDIEKSCFYIFFIFFFVLLMFFTDQFVAWCWKKPENHKSGKKGVTGESFEQLFLHQLFFCFQKIVHLPNE